MRAGERKEVGGSTISSGATVTRIVSVGGRREGGVGTAPLFGQGAGEEVVITNRGAGSLGEGGGTVEPKRKQARTVEREGGRAEVSAGLGEQSDGQHGLTPAQVTAARAPGSPPVTWRRELLAPQSPGEAHGDGACAQPLAARLGLACVMSGGRADIGIR